MKKVLNTVKILAIALILLVSTGCVKYNTTMEIKSNKSMTLTTIYAVESSILESQGMTELMTDDQKKQLTDKGYKVEEYSEGTMVGYKLSISVPSIDFVSAEGNVEYDLSAVLQDDSTETPKIFGVEKGLLKNKYVARLTFAASDVTGDMGDITGGDADVDVSDDDLTPAGDEATNPSDEVAQREGEDDTLTDNDQTSPSDGDFNLDDLTNLLTNLDLSFTVKLPTAPISNNATKTENDGKTLIWTLTSSDLNSIEFEFELYNYLYMGIMGGAVLLLIVLIIIIISKKKKGKKVAEKVQPAEVAQAFTTEQPVAPVEVPPMAAAPVMTAAPAPVAPVAPVAPAPVAPAPVSPAPVEVSPVAPAPVVPTPVEVAPVAAPVMETPVVPAPIAEPVVTPVPVEPVPVAAPVVESTIVAPVPAEPAPVATPVMEAAPVAAPVEVAPITAQPVQIDVIAGTPVQPVEVAPVTPAVPVEGADNGAFQMQPVQIDVVAGTPIQPVEVAPVQPIEPVPGDAPQA